MTTRTARLTTALTAGVLLLTACGGEEEDAGGADSSAAVQSTTDGTSAEAGGSPTDATSSEDPTSEGEQSGGEPSDAEQSGGDAVVEVSRLDGDECPGDTEDADHPDVVGATFTPAADGSYEVAVTLCSLYDSPDRYADAWRVATLDGEVLGTRELLHDHAGEQPFTRSLSGTLTLPDGVTTVVVEARDQANGWGGSTLEVELG